MLSQGEKMESGSAVVQQEEKKKKYHIYVEEYVLSYLRREADSLELSEIYFYGSRQDDGRKIYVYGAGRDKGIEAFAQYEPLSELVCRLTQAGPVFMVREANGECRVNGFQVFYDNNEAMQSYLLEWTGSTEKSKSAEKEDRQEIKLPVLIPSGEKPKKEAHGAISVQLCLILMLLTAIVVTSTDSYDKMQQLGQSAKEVFFAIENQEAGDTAEDLGNAEDRNEIVVERNAQPEEKPAAEIIEGEPTETGKEPEEATEPEADAQIAAADKADEPEEGLLQTVSDKNVEETASQEQNQEQTSAEEEKSSKTEEEPEDAAEEGEEALSRSVTRYYEVEQGDTLYTISQKIYGDFSRVEKICEVNQITDPDKIRSGQRIILP